MIIFDCVSSGEEQPVPRERRKKKKGPKKPPPPSSPARQLDDDLNDDPDIDSVPIAPQAPGSRTASSKNLKALDMNQVFFNARV